MDTVALDARTPPELLRSWHAMRSEIDRELEPHVRPAPLDEAFGSAVSDDLIARQGWLLVEAATVVGAALLELPLLDNPHLAMLDVRVDARHRRQGLGTTLIGLAAHAAHDAGRRTLLLEAVDASAAESLFAALGAKPALGSTASALRIANLDRSLLERWIARRDERANGYSLVRWIDTCPDDLIESCAKLREQMNTAPLGELDLVVESSPEIIRAAERAHQRRSWHSYVICARHDETAELVGLTDILVPRGRPTVGFQEDTVVRPDHRNRGLGRWIKAEMLRWLADEEPQLEIITTWNATENAAMRAINIELGFAPTGTWTEWQFDLAELLEQPQVRSSASTSAHG